VYLTKIILYVVCNFYVTTLILSSDERQSLVTLPSTATPCADKGYEITFSYLLRFTRPREDTHWITSRSVWIFKLFSKPDR